jgi:hypothetical protein
VVRRYYRFLQWVGYTQSYRDLKAELKGAPDTLSPAEALAMPPLISGPSTRYPTEMKLAKWQR